MIYKPLLFSLLCLVVNYSFAYDSTYLLTSKILRDSIIAKGNRALKERPITVTATYCSRSAGGNHDFFSEGDYWWPDPKNPNGTYIQRDGMINPNNFVEHRKAIIRFSEIIGSLASAYKLTRREKYVKHASKHLNAWFVDTATIMNPSLLFAQAIKGKVTGRGTGIIDMIQMMEVVKGVEAMEQSKAMDATTLAKTKQWTIQKQMLAEYSEN